MSPTKIDKSTPVDSDVELNWPFLLKFQQDHSILSAFLGKVGNKLCSGIDTWKVRRLNQSRSKAVLLERFSIAFTANDKRQAEISLLPKTREIYLVSAYILPVSHSYGASTKNREIS